MKNNNNYIVIIDDDPLIVQRLVNLLQDDYNCLTAKTGLSGIAHVENATSDAVLVICDIDLPDVVGYDVCKAIKARHPKIYVMLLTGYSSKELRMKGFNAYADSFHDKTLDDAEIKLLIRNAFNTMKPLEVITEPDMDSCPNKELNNKAFEIAVKKRIIDYYSLPLDKRVAGQLSLDSIAEHFNLTTRTFQRRMAKVSGYSFIKYLAKTKLEKSKEYLIANYSITEISELFEYSSPSHYSREFKKHMNMTPNRFKINTQNLS